jgi:hypothetical protein
VVHHKTVGVTWFRAHKTKTGGSAGGDRIRAHQEASNRATRGMIEVLALGGREGPMDARPSDGLLTKMRAGVVSPSVGVLRSFSKGPVYRRSG